MLFVSWGTHFKCGADRIERLVSYSGGFTLRDGYFVEFEYKELEVKGHAGILLFISRPLEGAQNMVARPQISRRKNSIGS